jgi:hypothetical protein
VSEGVVLGLQPATPAWLDGPESMIQGGTMVKSIRDDSITFTDSDVPVCPFPVYEKLYDEQPVYRDPTTGNYILTRHEDVRKRCST